MTSAASQRLLGLRSKRGRSGRAGMQRMIGREGGAELELGDDLGVERLGERDALVPALQAARHPAHEDERVLGRLSSLAACATDQRAGAVGSVAA